MCSLSLVYAGAGVVNALTAGEDVQLLSRNVIECRHIRLKVLREHILGNVGEPIGKLG